MARCLVFPLFHFQFPASPATSAVGRGRTVGQWRGAADDGHWVVGSGRFLGGDVSIFATLRAF